ncbi:MAG TPA: ATP-binding protein [Bacteroidia bacterium]|nr:ATP-binding protein [Bacteroidia bacterium]
MNKGKRYIFILSVVFGYIILQFIAWEIMFVRKTGEITELKQKLAELSSTNNEIIMQQVNELHQKKKMQVIMIVGEGTVFLLLLLFGIYKIKQSLDKDRELAERQKNFFLSITHEFKTPVAAVKLQLQTLLKHQLEEKKKNELLSNAVRETERLNSLIDNILLASRLESGQFNFNLEEINLSTLTEQILHRYFSEEMANKQLSFVADETVMSRIDTTSFPSVITNLVSNALKYTPVEKKIKVELRKAQGKTELRVSDNGAGIHNAEKSKIFQRFYRSGTEETRKSKGAGLGLFITDYIVKNHGGKIEIQDNQPNGSIFVVTLYV